MSTYTTRVTAIRTRLQDLARDLESHLGLATRSYEAEPMFDRANHFPPKPYGQEAVDRARDRNVNRFVKEYGDQADRAALALRDLEVPGVVFTKTETAARDRVLKLVAAFHEVRNHADARALVAQLQEA